MSDERQEACVTLEQPYRETTPMSQRGELAIASCRSGSGLARKVVRRYQELLGQDAADVLYLPDIDFNFADSETNVRLRRHIAGHDAFLFQSLYDPTSERSVDENYMAFLIAIRAFREHGAEHVTAVLPYLAYSRQDKPTKFKREPTTARLMADLAREAGIDRLVTWAPHSAQIHGFYGSIRVDALESLVLFVDEFRRFKGQDDVIAIAPDEGAYRFVTYFGRMLDLKYAVASKYRPHPEEAMISQIVGDLSGKRVAIVLDDMISSGGTVYAVIRKLVTEHRIDDVYLGASHHLCMEQARQRLQELHADYHLRQVVVTNSVPQTPDFLNLPFVAVRDLSAMLARVIYRIHYNRSVSELFVAANM